MGNELNTSIEVIRNLSMEKVLETSEVYTNGDALGDSCRIAMKRKEFLDGYHALSASINRNFLSDNQFVKNYVDSNYKPMSKFAKYFLGYVFCSMGMGAGLMLSVVHFGTITVESFITGFLGIVLGIIVTAIIYEATCSSKKKKTYEEACERLKGYQKERDTFLNDTKPKTEYRMGLLKALIDKIEECLTIYENSNRNSLPRQYWCYAAEILNIYESRRADNLKEALAVLENDNHQQRMEFEMEMQMDQINSELRYASSVAESTNEYARQALAEAERANKNAETALFMQFLDTL